MIEQMPQSIPSPPKKKKNEIGTSYINAAVIVWDLTSIKLWDA